MPNLRITTHSPRGMTPIDPHIRPRHELRSIAQQEDCSPTIIFRLAQLIEHILLWPLLPPLRILNEQLLRHGSDDIARGNRVHADAILAPFRRQITSQLDDACFGGIVGWTDESLGIESVTIFRYSKGRSSEYVAAPYSLPCRSCSLSWQYSPLSQT